MAAELWVVVVAHAGELLVRVCTARAAATIARTARATAHAAAHAAPARATTRTRARRAAHSEVEISQLRSQEIRSRGR